VPSPQAIHGLGRLTRHPCRVAHCAEPPLGLPMGQTIKSNARRPTGRPGFNGDPCSRCRRLRSARRDAKPVSTVCLIYRSAWFYGRFAPDRSLRQRLQEIRRSSVHHQPQYRFCSHFHYSSSFGSGFGFGSGFWSWSTRPFPRGRTQVLRRGYLGRDAEVAALGQGWPIAAAPGAGPEW